MHPKLTKLGATVERAMKDSGTGMVGGGEIIGKRVEEMCKVVYPARTRLFRFEW